MFERFSDGARQVIVLAQDEARALRHNYIGTEHLLLGLVREEHGLAARVLASFDLTVEDVRAQVARAVGQGDEVTTGQIPFSPDAKKLLEQALHQSLSLGHNYVGTEHLLLGLARLEQCVGTQILRGFGVEMEKLRDGVIHGITSAAKPPEGRWEYDVKTLAGTSDAWVAQLEEWRTDGWELISVVQEGGAVRAIVERRRRDTA